MQYLKSVLLAGTIAISGISHAASPQRSLDSTQVYAARPYRNVSRGLKSYNRNELIKLIESERQQHKTEISELETTIRELRREQQHYQDQNSRLRELIRGLDEQAQEHRESSEECQDTNASLLEKLHATEALVEKYSAWVNEHASQFLRYHGIREHVVKDHRYFFLGNQRDESHIRHKRRVDMGYPALNITIQQNQDAIILKQNAE